MGWAYGHGEGVDQNLEEAFRWYQLAADQGYVTGQYYLAFSYGHGVGVDQDLEEAFRWHLLAADQGHSTSQNEVGLAYARGEGIPQDPEEANRWYRLAADQGNEMAQYNLGWAYGRGVGVAPNPAESVRWFQLAADQGFVQAKKALEVIGSVGEPEQMNGFQQIVSQAEAGKPTAQYELGEAYWFGREGATRNHSLAVGWYRKAAEQGTNKIVANAAAAKLAVAYRLGKGVELDSSECFYWALVSLANRFSESGSEFANECGNRLSLDVQEKIRKKVNANMRAIESMALHED